MSSEKIVLDGESLDPLALWEFSKNALNPRANISIAISKKAEKNILKASQFVKKIAQGDAPVYGINTGFGKFAEVVISKELLSELQKNLILSHSAGIGEPLTRDLVLCLWIIRLNTICRGNSGVRPEIIQKIIHSLESGLLSEIPSRGSVGASGDLAPSAHATLPLLGEGYCTLPRGNSFERVSARDALKKINLPPLELGPKEGLSLINGTQFTSALAIKALYEGYQLLHTANLSCAMLVEGVRGSHHPYDERIFLARQHQSASRCAAEIRTHLVEKKKLGNTAIAQSHHNCGRVQDPYSLRCAPQVHGAVLETLDHGYDVLTKEINSSTDNPLLFVDDGDSLTNGNFHAIYPARVSDSLASALSTLANISERRIALAMVPETSLHPTFLIKDGGLHSGMMIPQYTAAALVSENKSLSFPASVDSIPTSANREDHVSMGPIAGFKALKICENTRHVFAIELMVAAQAIELLRPLRSSASIEEKLAVIRRSVKFLEKDRVLHFDILALSQLVSEGTLL